MVFIAISSCIRAQEPGSDKYNELLFRINQQKETQEFLNNRKNALLHEKETISEAQRQQVDALIALRKDSAQLAVQLTIISDSIKFIKNNINAARIINQSLETKAKAYKGEDLRREALEKRLNLSTQHLDKLKKEIDSLTNNLKDLGKQKSDLASAEQEYFKSAADLNEKSADLFTKQLLLKYRRDSLQLLQAIYSNAQKIRDDNAKNAKAWESRICAAIQRVVVSEDYSNKPQTDFLTALRDSIIDMKEKFQIDGPEIQTCKASADQFLKFSAWVQKANNALNRDFDKAQISALLTENLKETTKQQRNARGALIALLSQYCKKYSDAVKSYAEFSLYTSERIMKEKIDSVITAKFKDYPYLVSEFTKKIQKPAYKCQFNASPVCD